LISNSRIIENIHCFRFDLARHRPVMSSVPLDPSVSVKWHFFVSDMLYNRWDLLPLLGNCPK
jgi:hypothetical protein